jgi:hypothetical protein
MKDSGGNWKSKIQRAKRQGYDAIVYLNRYEGTKTENVIKNQGKDLDRISDNQFKKLFPEASDSYIVFSEKQVKIIPGGMGLSLGPSPSTKLTKQSLEKAIKPLSKNWKNKPRIITVASQTDLPESLKAEVMKRGIEGRIRGVIHKGKVYLVAQNIENEEQAAKTVIHEVAGHWGLRQILGNDYAPTMRGIYIENRKDIKAATTKYDFDFSTKADRYMATEEWLAQEAESAPESSFVQRVVSVIRKVLRRLFPNLTWNNAEIQSLLQKSREYVESGGKRARVKIFDPYLQQGEPAAVWYSQMQNVLSKKLQGTGTPKANKTASS